MSRCIAQITLKRKGGLPKDWVTNTMHFEDDTSGIGEAGGIEANGPGLVNRLKAFYGSVGQAGLSTLLTGEGVIKLYDAADAMPRIPRIITEFSVPFVSGTPLPGEVAACLSFRASPLPGVDPARRRGRIFLGPLASSVVGSGANADVFLQPNFFRVPVLKAARTMATGGGGAYRLAVFSGATTPVGAHQNTPADHDDASYNDVTEFWMDDAFDTIRKRGGQPRARLTLPNSGTGEPVGA